jgi:acetoin utilization deacetylase AcuC-like enzyme
VALFDHPIFREHDAGPGHPESAARLDAVRRGLADAGLEGRLDLRTPREATVAELARVHTRPYVDAILGTAGRTVRFDADTQASPRSSAAALHAAGAVLDAVSGVLSGDFDQAFCAVRPPGHHALPDRAMGFCLFNNVAVGAAHARALGVERVAIIDWDVHHGNGTEAMFWEDPSVLYVSSHEYPFYPGTGAISDVGGGAGKGYTLNLPLPAGLGDSAYDALYRGLVEPVVLGFRPELVLVSVGFDPHEDDPLAGMRVTERGFGALSASCRRMASGTALGRAIFVLEGGYNLAGIAASTAAVARVLLGQEQAALPSEPEGLVSAYRRHLAADFPALAG